jgi:heme/copper-type cytochrome/quinol oxidase subunit 3
MVLFWVVFHFILSSYYMLIESISIPEPCELAYGAALLLSSAGVSMGSVLITRDCLGIYYWSVISSLAYSVVFVLVQGREFSWLGYWVDDSELGCIYMYLSGLHFIHVLYGIMILGASSDAVSPLEVLPVYTVSLDMYYIVDCCYWHMVEMVYIYIYITLYYYYDILCQSQCYSYSSC